MARLIDKLLLTRFRTSRFKEFFEVLPTAEVIVADNVAKYYFDNADKGWSPKDFPNLAPPFGAFFVDFRFSYGQTKAMNVGCLFISARVETEAEKASIRQMIGERSVSAADDAHWCMVCIPIVPIRDGIVEPTYAVRMILKSSGELLYADDGWPVMDVEFDDMTIDEVARSRNLDRAELKRLMANTFHQIGYPALLALSFLHCKNVTMQRETPPAPLSKKYAKRHGRPLMSYHTLSIEPMKKVLRTEGNSEKTGLKQALHICRGHFKDFSKGKGLFGKYKGMYFWESQVRGSVSEGIVDKDYAVKAPKEG